MSTQQQKQEQQRRRDEETNLNVSHLATSIPDDDEDWGNRPQTSSQTTTRVEEKDEDLERELAKEEEQEVNEVQEMPTPTVPQHPAMDESSVIQQIDQMQQNLPALERVLQSKLDNLKQERTTQNQKWDEEERAFVARINFLRAISGAAPLATAQPVTEQPRRKRGRPPRSESNTPSHTTPTEGEKRGERGKRFKNDQTLKDAICKSLLHMQNGGRAYTGKDTDIAIKVTTEQKYKTTSSNPTNTVRIQMYRLAEEGKVFKNDDGTYTLSKEMVRHYSAPATVNA